MNITNIGHIHNIGADIRQYHVGLTSFQIPEKSNTILMIYIGIGWCLKPSYRPYWKRKQSITWKKLKNVKPVKRSYVHSQNQYPRTTFRVKEHSHFYRIIIMKPHKIPKKLIFQIRYKANRNKQKRNITGTSIPTIIRETFLIRWFYMKNSFSTTDLAALKNKARIQWTVIYLI